jgi:hypothetical protein
LEPRSLWAAQGNNPTLEGFPVLILLAVEELLALNLGHLQNGTGFAFALPFLRPGVDRLARDFEMAVVSRE